MNIKQQDHTMYHIASEEKHKDGDIVFREGSSGDWVYVVLSGSVEIFKTIRGKDIVIELLGEGEIFGELSYLGGIKRTASVRARGDSILGVIDRTFLDKEFNTLSKDLRSIVHAVVGRFKKMIERATDYSTRVEGRVQKTLTLQFKTTQSLKNACTDNISPGGLFIATKNPLEKGEQFLLKLQLPGLTDPLSIQCGVIWSRKEGVDVERKPPGMGVQFLSMSQQDETALRDLLSH